MRQFPVVMRGYSRREVDELFARIDATLGHAAATATPVRLAEIRSATFRTQMRGYAPGDVDAALRDAVRELEDRED